MANMRKITVTHLTLGMVWATTYLTVLTEVLYPVGKK